MLNHESLVGRYYDPGTGQFLNVDPLVDETGQAYVYTGDDPVDSTDPSGNSGEGYAHALLNFFQDPNRLVAKAWTTGWAKPQLLEVEATLYRYEPGCPLIRLDSFRRSSPGPRRYIAETDPETYRIDPNYYGLTRYVLKVTAYGSIAGVGHPDAMEEVINGEDVW